MCVRDVTVRRRAICSDWVLSVLHGLLGTDCWLPCRPTPHLRRLYYTAALENAASAMEIAAIEGRMTALLTAQHLKGQAAARAGTAGQQRAPGDGTVLRPPSQDAEQVAAAA